MSILSEAPDLRSGCEREPIAVLSAGDARGDVFGLLRRTNVRHVLLRGIDVSNKLIDLPHRRK